MNEVTEDKNENRKFFLDEDIGWMISLNDKVVTLLHRPKMSWIINLDRVIFRNCSNAMLPFFVCEAVFVILLSSKILEVISFVDDIKYKLRFLLNLYKN